MPLGRTGGVVPLGRSVRLGSRLGGRGLVGARFGLGRARGRDTRRVPGRRARRVVGLRSSLDWDVLLGIPLVKMVG